jgi:hypothetical protein
LNADHAARGRTRRGEPGHVEGAAGSPVPGIFQPTSAKPTPDAAACVLPRREGRKRPDYRPRVPECGKREAMRFGRGWLVGVRTLVDRGGRKGVGKGPWVLPKRPSLLTPTGTIEHLYSLSFSWAWRSGWRRADHNRNVEAGRWRRSSMIVSTAGNRGPRAWRIALGGVDGAGQVGPQFDAVEGVVIVSGESRRYENMNRGACVHSDRGTRQFIRFPAKVAP